MVARPLCHIEYPVAYLSRLQRILLVTRWKLCFKADDTAHLLQGLGQRHVPLGTIRPLLWVEKWTVSTHIASSSDSNLESFNYNPAHSSFTPLAFQPRAMTNCATQ
ncbi:Hypothetical predicted protein [Olea europaea subsp. europaea]|uniref:Uncharacterized protein n=1 Tax=Olea europaea subsp. europaea TaxID=158383 RepID=A0A8S0PN87_OLEEU|nr:Hypothetical predicted protein [Olea europaea subsp. europaea]